MSSTSSESSEAASTLSSSSEESTDPPPGPLTCPPVVKGCEYNMNAVRLLRFDRRSTPTSIVCSMTTIPFADRPQYEVLSYQEGDFLQSTPITVNGRPVLVGMRLFNALKFLLRRSWGGDKQLFWIYNLCVNCQDPNERSQYVFEIPQVFFRATAVLAWLGEKYNKYRNPLDRIEARHILGIEEASAAPEPDEAMLRGEIGKDAYWNRAWTMPATMFSRQILVCLGHNTISWTRLLCWISKGDASPGGRIQLLDNQRRNKHNRPDSLLEVFEANRFCQANDPRDKFYALWHMLDPVFSGDQEFYPDYECSLLEVWTKAVNIINTSSSPEYLNFLPDDIIAFRLVRDFLGLTIDQNQPGDIIHLVGIGNSVHPTPDDLFPMCFNYNLEVLGYVANIVLPSTQDFIEDPFTISSDILHSDDPAHCAIEEKIIARLLDSNCRYSVFPRRVASQLRKNQPNAAQSGPINQNLPEPSTKESNLLAQIRCRDRSITAAIVPPDAEPGDMLCQLPRAVDASDPQLVIVRHVGKVRDEPRYRILGTSFTILTEKQAALPRISSLSNDPPHAEILQYIHNYGYTDNNGFHHRPRNSEPEAHYPLVLDNVAFQTEAMYWLAL